MPACPRCNVADVSVLLDQDEEPYLCDDCWHSECVEFDADNKCIYCATHYYQTPLGKNYLNEMEKQEENA